MQRTVLEAKRLGVFTCHPYTTLQDATCQMVSRDVSALVVVNESGALEGIISRTDLLRAYLNDTAWQLQPVSTVMNTDVVTVSPEETMATVAKLLLEDRIHRVVVVDAQSGTPIPIAVVADSDFVYHMSKEVCRI